MRKIVITGGAGFAGSHIVDQACQHYPDARILVLDKMTYAGDVRNVVEHVLTGRIQLIVGDVADLETCCRVLSGADLVIHAAAESHVDNSFGNSLEFTRTNVLGTHCLIEACRQGRVPRFVHISTDEVYGEILTGSVDEEAILRPTNPYSASKAGAEMILRGYVQSYASPVVMVRANNLYGQRQFPEKIIPRFICNLLSGQRLPIHGDGSNRRHYLSALDFARAVLFLADHGVPGEIYNVGTNEEYTNLEIAQMIASQFGQRVDEVVDFVPDRPFNDARYAISWDKLSTHGWSARQRLRDDLPALVAWYAENLDRYTELSAAEPSAPRPPDSEPPCAEPAHDQRLAAEFLV